MKSKNEKDLLNKQLSKDLADAFKTHDIAVVWNKKNILFNFSQFQSKFLQSRLQSKPQQIQFTSHTQDDQQYKTQNDQQDNEQHNNQKHNQKIVAVTIKNDLYGAPLEKILPYLPCNDFFGSTLQECIEARNILQENTTQQNTPQPNNQQQNTQEHHEKQHRIYMLHGFIPGQEEKLNKYKIIPCINSISQLKIWHEKFPYNPYVLHLDTGMSRHGISLQEAKELVQGQKLEKETAREKTQRLDQETSEESLQNSDFTHFNNPTHSTHSTQPHDYIENALFYMTHFYGIKEDFNNFPNSNSSNCNFRDSNFPNANFATTTHSDTTHADITHSDAYIYNSESTFFKQIQRLKQFLEILPSRPLSFSATDAAMALYFTHSEDSTDLINLINPTNLTNATNPTNLTNATDSTNFINDIPTENIIRPGVGIVGGVPTQDYLHFLKIAFSVFTRISSITKVPAGENISYGINSYNEDKTIGVINVGYGDGYMKILKGTYVCVHFQNENFNHHMHQGQNQEHHTHQNNQSPHSYQTHQKFFCKTIAINLNCSVIDCSEIPDEILKSFDTAVVELCGENIDIREFAVKDGCYQVYALGSKGKNKKTLCIE